VPRQVDPASDSGDLPTAWRLSAALNWLWVLGGYLAEGRHWHERVIERAGGSTSPQLATSLGALANLLMTQGELEQALDAAERSLTMARSVGDPAAAAYALSVLGIAQLQAGDLGAARANLQESLDGHRQSGDQRGLARALGHLAGIEEELGSFDRAEKLIRESLQLLETHGDLYEEAVQRQNLANVLALAGRAEEALDVARGLVDRVLALRSPNLTMAFANTCMNILLRLGDAVRAARLFGAEEAMHERLSIPNPFHDEELEEALDLVADTMSAEDWNRHRRLGQGLRVEDVLVDVRAAT